jgi:hypothetical protein
MDREDLRAVRLASNEAAVRTSNDRLVRPDDPDWVIGSRALELECECANPDCREKLATTYRKYAEVRQDPLAFFVAPGHDLPDIEEVVEGNERLSVVRKLGIGRDVAERTDPRA